MKDFMSRAMDRMIFNFEMALKERVLGQRFTVQEQEDNFQVWITPEARLKREQAYLKQKEKEEKERQRKDAEAEERARLMLHIYAPDQVYDRSIHGIIEDEEEDEDWWDRV